MRTSAMLKKKANKSKAPAFDEKMQAQYNSRLVYFSGDCLQIILTFVSSKETVTSRTIKERQQLTSLQRELKNLSEDRLRKEESLEVSKSKEAQLVDEEQALEDRRLKVGVIALLRDIYSNNLSYS
jgi:hypothetical protein